MLKKWRAFILACTLLMVLCAVYVSWQYVSIQSYGHRIRPRPSDVLIVLGAQVWGDHPSPALQERLDWALQLYKQGYARAFILSGGMGSGTVTEAQAMRTYLLAKGVPESALILEQKSHTTKQNIANSFALMKVHHEQTAVIVTDDFHQKRAQTFARQFGMKTSGFGGRTQCLSEPLYTLREVFAITVECWPAVF